MSRNVEFGAMKVRHLKVFLADRGVAYGDFVEKPEFVAAALAHVDDAIGIGTRGGGVAAQLFDADASAFAAFLTTDTGAPPSTSSTVVPIERSVGRLVTAHQQREGGGFVVRRPVGGELATVDPFLMLDHLDTVYGPGEAVGAPDHPHRGFETVSYIISGGLQHLDSQGNRGNLEAGWVQWMTAGSGVVHSEMPTDRFLEEGGPLLGFQLWVNLPAKDKMVAPRYQDTPPEKIPKVTRDDGKVWVNVIAGEAMGVPAYIETRTPIVYLDVRIKSGGSYAHAVPRDFNVFAYVYRGAGSFGTGDSRRSLGKGQVIMFSGDGNTVTGNADSGVAANDDEDGVGGELHYLLIGGVPINEPIARYGPFVMNTEEEIRQAFADYQSGKLGRIDGAEERYAKTEAAVSHQKATGRYDVDSQSVDK